MIGRWSSDTAGGGLVTYLGIKHDKLSLEMERLFELTVLARHCP